MSPTIPQPNTLTARLLDLLRPLHLLALSLLALPGTLLSNPLLIFSPRTLQSVWFSNLWHAIGPQMALSPDQTPYIASLFSRAHGVVLELGPGAGDQMRHLIEVVRTGQVQRVVGAEPNAALHDRLRLNARGVGLNPGEGRYVVLEAGAEPASLIPALHKAGLYTSGDGDGVFDTIICVKSLCSTPQRQLPQILTTIQTLLKPGGEFLFFEHVANDTDWVTMAYVWCLGWVWPVAMGNCHLDGRVDAVVGRIGGWESVDVGNTREFGGWNVMRYVVGVCRK